MKKPARFFLRVIDEFLRDTFFFYFLTVDVYYGPKSTACAIARFPDNCGSSKKKRKEIRSLISYLRDMYTFTM